MATKTSLPEPKRRNAAKTRAKILDAAKKAFSESSYSSVGIRDIAAMADVSSTLLIRYFGSKAGLFEAALLDAMHLGLQLENGKAGFGQQFVDRLMEVREVRPPIMLALAAGDAEAQEIAVRVTRTRAIAPLAEWLGPPHAHARALQIIMLATNFSLYYRLLPLIPNSEEADGEMARWLKQTVQAIVDQS